MTVRTRFAPSPTGSLHVGGARTALFAWLFARRHGGEFILRIEDTDRERSTQDSVDAILEAMVWLELDCDEGPIYQTDRFDRYAETIRRLLDEGLAYHCYCSREALEQMRVEQRARGLKPRYDGRCRHRHGPPPAGVDPVVRFKNPLDGEVIVDDLVRGPMVFANAELDDLVIARPDGTPTYNFTVVVDDLEMGITHVIRGDDHINNTPRQMNILRAFGAALPRYAHVPMILGPDGERLSKRHGAVSVTQFRQEGYLPQALLNYLVRLGWSHGDQEIFSREEMIALFDVADVNRAAAAFDWEKLQWLNQHYIKQMPSAELGVHLGEQLAAMGVDTATGPSLADVAALQRERAKTLCEMAENSVYFFQDFDDYDEKAARKHLGAAAAGALAAAGEKLARLTGWTAVDIHAAVTSSADTLDVKLGKVAQPLRVAATGRSFSPPIDATLALIGRERTLERIARALTWIAARDAAS